MPVPSLSPGEMRLYATDGQRLYLNRDERVRFLEAADRAPALARIFCLTLAHTGCRLSEARFLRRSDVQLGQGLVAFQTLKRRKPGHIREVPIPEALVQCYLKVHAFEMEQSQAWLFSDDATAPPRTRCYRWVKSVMEEAGIAGLQACPKGLRHGYGIHAIQSGVQLHMLQKWMGHAAMETTAIYATALGPEEREIAARMW